MMDVSRWYQLFLYDQIHQKVTDTHCSVSPSWWGMCQVVAEEQHGPRGMSVQHVINKADWWCHHLALKWMNLLLSSSSTLGWTTHTQPAPTDTQAHISSYTRTHTKDTFSLALPRHFALLTKHNKPWAANYSSPEPFFNKSPDLSFYSSSVREVCGNPGNGLPERQIE